MGWISARLVDDICEHIGTESGKAFTGDRVSSETLDKGPVGGFELFGIFRGTGRHPGIVEDDDLHPLSAHDRTDPSAPSMTGGPQFHVRKGHGRGGHFHLSCLADGNAAILSPYSLFIFRPGHSCEPFQLLSG